MRHFILGTAGHVDHGKTALVQALTGMDCDTHPQEKSRGLTISPGYAYLPDGQGGFLSFVDLPGHDKFISNMISGAMTVDYVLLVIAADDGIMPQTREHLLICSLLGIRSGAVVISKTDLVNEFRLEELKREIRDFLKDTFLESSRILEISSRTGSGISALKDYLLQETSLSDVQDPQADSRYFRMNIDRCFSVRGVGTIVAGTARGDSVSSDQELYLFPSGEKVRIRSMQHHAETVLTAYDRERVAMNLPGIGKDEIAEGSVLCSRRLEPVGLLDVVLVFPDRRRFERMTASRRVEVNVGTAKTDAQVRMLFSDPESLRAYVQVTLHRVQYILRSDRLIFRDVTSNEILAGGWVLDPSPLVHRKLSDMLLSDLRLLDSGKLTDFIQVKVSRSPRLMTVEDLSALSSFKPDFIRKQTAEEDRFVICRNKVLLKSDLQEYLSALEQAYSVFQTHHPLAEWTLDRRAFFSLASSWKIKPLPEENRQAQLLFQEWLLEQGLVLCYDGICFLKKWNIILSEGPCVFLPQEENELRFLEAARKGEIFTKVGRYYFLSTFLQRMQEMALKYLGNHPAGLTLMEFKSLSGLSRKQALALLEYLENQEYLIREGDVRLLNRN